MAATPKSDLRHVRLRDRYLHDYPNTIFGLGEWRRYDSGWWPPVHELIIRREIQQMATSQQQVTIKVDNGLVSSLFALIKAHQYIPDNQFDHDENMLVFDDCTLNFLTNERRGHLPENYRTNKLPFAFDAEAKSPAWEKFLNTTVSPEVSDFLREFTAYCMTQWTKYEVAVWLYGPPGGGKSTFIAGLEAMLGAQCGVLGLSDIETSNFGLTNLPGKTLVISTEQPAHFIKSAHIVNALISGERVSVDRKFRDPITFRSKCKMLWAMNELPRVDDKGAGIFRRVKLVHFPAIEESSRDPHIKEEIQQSGMAVMNWAMPGLASLIARGRFNIPSVINSATEHYRLANDIPKMFVEECCEVDSSEKTQAQTLYDTYKTWCVETGHKPLAMTRFSDEMQRLGFHKVKIGKHYYRGLKLKT